MNFPNFCRKKNSLELLNIIFENSSPKRSFGANKKKFEFSLLSPDSRKLLTTALKIDSGLDPDFLDLVKKDFSTRSDPKDYDVWVGIIHDEVSLRKDLVFDDSGKLIGFVNLGSVQNNIDDLEQSLSSQEMSSITPEEATHMFVFMVVSLFSGWKMPVAFFPHYYDKVICLV